MGTEGEAGTEASASPSPASRIYHPANLKIRLGCVAGWRRSALLGGLGVAAAMALPPVYGLPLLIPAFVGLLWTVETSPGPVRAFSAGWWFGFLLRRLVAAFLVLHVHLVDILQAHRVGSGQ